MTRRLYLTKGTFFEANLQLSGMETWATNAYIANIFKEAGFTNVFVTGSGAHRFAHGTWNKESRKVDIPPQVRSIRGIA